MKNKTLSLDVPYSAMLTELQSVAGFDEFKHYISTRGKQMEETKTEIKALFEINKPQHPLISIQSQGIGEPEAYYQASKSKQGLIEARYITSSLLEQQQKIKCALNCNNQFRRLTKVLPTDDAAIVIVVSSPATAVPGQLDREYLEAFVRNFGFSSIALNREFGEIRLFTKYKTTDEDDIFASIGEKGICVRIGTGGVYLHALQPNPTDKIIRCLKEKRQARSRQSADLFRVYYFVLSCPVAVMWSVDTTQICKQLNNNELVVLSTTEDDGKGTLVEEKFVLMNGADITDFNVDNKYIASYSGTRAIGRLNRAQVFIRSNGEMIEARAHSLPPGMRYEIRENDKT